MDMSQDKGTVIVTGGAWYIGSHTVVELAAAGYEPVILDNFSNSERFVVDRIAEIVGRDIKCCELDCRDGDSVLAAIEAESNVCGVIHFAAFKSVPESVREPLKYYENNIGATVTLLDLLKKASVDRFVFSSSCTVYGQPDQLPVTEKSPFLPAQSPYGRTKQVCEAALEDVVRAEYPLRIATLRYFNPIGAHHSSLIGELPRGIPDNLVPYIVQTAAGLRESLTIFGNDYNTPDGTCVRDYIHVVDLARAHVRALDWLDDSARAPSNHVFNLGAGRGTSVLEAVNAFIDVTGQKLDYVMGPRRSGDIEQIHADVTKAKKVLGWTTELSIGDAMRDAWRWQVRLANG